MQLLYITVPTNEEATKIAHYLVDSELVACVNIIKNVTSIYKWEGKTEESAEIVMIAKTTDNLVNIAIEEIKTLHSYDCPCIISIKIEDGNKDFIKWLESSVKLPY